MNRMLELEETPSLFAELIDGILLEANVKRDVSDIPFQSDIQLTEDFDEDPESDSFQFMKLIIKSLHALGSLEEALKVRKYHCN